LGTYNQIDSLQLKWQSGVVDTYYNISANALHALTEAETRPVIVASKAMLCPTGNDNLNLSITGWPNHTWGNGSTADSILVTAPGVYSVTVGTGYGHTLMLNYEVQMATLDNFAINRTPLLCAGDSTGFIEVVHVASGQTVFTMNNLAAGDYVVPITLFEGCVSEQHVLIEEPLPFALQVDSIANTCFGYSNGAALLRGIEGTAPYAGFNDIGVLYLNNLLPGNYSDTISDANGCAATYSFEIQEISSPAITAVTTIPAPTFPSALAGGVPM
jgi:hypothetical protein